MRRFDCPACRRPLGFRLLRHVPRGDGRMAFACAHCGAVLTYTDNVPIMRLMFGTPVRSVVTFIAGLVVFSVVEVAASPLWRYAAIAAVAAVLGAAYTFSSKPAYQLIREIHSE